LFVAFRIRIEWNSSVDIIKSLWFWSTWQFMQIRHRIYTVFQKGHPFVFAITFLFVIRF